MAISSRRMRLSSLVETYLSRATRSSMRRIILTVVSTPTSEVMSTSSRSSSTSSSTVDFPATARASLPNTLSLVFSSPLSRVSFFLLLNNPNNPIILFFIFCKDTHFFLFYGFFTCFFSLFKKKCKNLEGFMS